MSLSKHMDLVGICMDTLSSSDSSQRFVFFFGLIDFVVEDPKIDPIPFFFFLVLLSTSWKRIGETYSFLWTAVRGSFFFD